MMEDGCGFIVVRELNRGSGCRSIYRKMRNRFCSWNKEWAYPLFKETSKIIPYKGNLLPIIGR